MSSTGGEVLSMIILFTLLGRLLSTSTFEAIINGGETEISTIQKVTVYWSGISNPTIDDWIGIYCPYNKSDHQYIGWIWANMSSTWSSGNGMYTFQLLNMRYAYQFRYFQNGYSLVNSSNLIQVDPYQAMQGHIQLTDNNNEMRVMWVTGLPYIPYVRYGFSSDNLEFSATGNSSTYTVEDLKKLQNDSYAVEKFFDPGYIHDVVLQNLRPNTKYYYSYGSPLYQWSAIDTFVSPKQVGPNIGIKIIAMGDMGTSLCENMIGSCENSIGTTDFVYNYTQNNIIDMVLLIGDLSYAMGDAQRWDQFFYQIEPSAKTVPWMVSVGNHDYDYENQPFKPGWANYGEDSEGECGVPYTHRFHMPNNNQYWWSLNYGNVHFLIWSGEHDFTRGSEQWNWIMKDLESVNRTVTPFVIVGGHRPMYCSENYPSDLRMSYHIQEELEDLFFTFKVDLAIWGHYHAYERTCPVYKQKCAEDEKAPIHVVMGMAGAQLDTENWLPFEWSIFRDHSNWGISVITTNTTHLTLEYLNNGNYHPTDKVAISNKWI